MASRYLAVWLVTVQLSPAASARKQAETANFITQTDRRSGAGMFVLAVRPARELASARSRGQRQGLNAGGRDARQSGHFDPAAGASLGAYAGPCVSGELKRYFRDKRWALRVKRPVQELVLQVRDATGPLAQQLGRTPADSDLARHLGVSGDTLRQARQAEVAFQPSSLDAPPAGQTTIGTLAGRGMACLRRPSYVAGIVHRWDLRRRWSPGSRLSMEVLDGGHNSLDFSRPCPAGVL